jgi:hypothetical protein
MPDLTDEVFLSQPFFENYRKMIVRSFENTIPKILD